MQGSFEKKVQEKLDELKLTPSAPVWEKIELEIKEEKKRRTGFLWIPLLIFLLAGAGWWLWERTEKKGTDMASTTIKPSSQKQNREQKALTNEKQIETTIHSNKSERNIQPLATGTGLHSNDKIKSVVITPAAKQPLLQRRNRNNYNEPVASEQQAQTNYTPLLAEKFSNLTITDRKRKTSEESEVLPVDSVAQMSSSPADSSKINSLSTEKKPAPNVADTAAAKPKVAWQSKKWNLQLTVQAGWSKPAPDELSASRDANASPTQNTGSGGFSNSYTYPSRISRGTAYAVGISLAKDISRRWKVSAGLQYAVYQTHSRVGSFRPLDTTLRFQSRMLNVGGYFRNGNLQEYTTRSQVLELPVSLTYQVFSSLPLFLSAGGTYGRILKSNALTYDRISNVYYENKENLTRNQFAVFSALQYGIINKKGFGLRAGPVIQYQLTSFQKETGTASPRLLFAGLKTALEF